MTTPPRRVAVFVGSSDGRDPRFRAAAGEVARHLAAHGVGLVYGGAHVGLMGVLADAALAAGGEVHGVIPRSMVDREIAHRGLTRLDVVDSMHERKARMAEVADAFVALPGGMGTLEELFEVWTWQQLGLLDAPVVLYDVDGFWRPLRAMVDDMVEHGFLAARARDALLHADDPDGLLEVLGAPRDRTTVWDDRAR